MARVKKSNPAVAEVRPYLEGVAKNLADRIWGPNGPAWGTKLTELEDLVVEVREVLSEKMLHQALERQAADTDQQPAEVRSCPGCQGETRSEEAETRLVTTRGGEAEWQEPHRYCPKCRRAFFPSVAKPGD